MIVYILGPGRGIRPSSTFFTMHTLTYWKTRWNPAKKHTTRVLALIWWKWSHGHWRGSRKGNKNWDMVRMLRDGEMKLNFHILEQLFWNLLAPEAYAEWAPRVKLWFWKYNTTMMATASQIWRHNNVFMSWGQVHLLAAFQWILAWWVKLQRWGLYSPAWGERTQYRACIRRGHAQIMSRANGGRGYNIVWQAMH